MIDVKKLLSEINIVDVVSRHLSLKKKGVEYFGKCPFHDDHKDSLQVNEKKQIYKCFACGAGAGDSIDFLQRMGATFHEACNELSSGDFQEKYTPQQRAANKKKVNSWSQVIPAPGIPQSISHWVHGEPSKSWVYKTAAGEPIGYVCRFDLEDGKKEVLPFVYASDGSRSEWRWMGFQKPRPMYNLDLIQANPNASILWVEGEKTADAAQLELDASKTVASTWIGGSNALQHTDFSPADGRVSIYWPDHDPAGVKAMQQLHEIIKAGSPVSKWVEVPGDLPNKWDAADKDWQPGELRKFVRNHMGGVPVVEEVPTELPPMKVLKPTATKDQKLPPKPPAAPKITENDALYYSILGYDKNENSQPVFYFYSYGAKCVFKYSAQSLSKSVLITMAPINYWENRFPGRSKTSRIDLDAVQQYLINTAYKIGPFREKFIRGRGAWIDEKKIVIHTGDELIVERKPYPLNGMKSKYVYEIGEKLGLGSDKILPNNEAKQLLDFTKWLKWDREINAYLLAGWCIIAPFCGILQWRPHVWVTGPAGSGKSWTMDNIVKRLLGEAAVVVQGKTTEAGVRGLLQNDARAVLFDESDVDSHNDKERIQNILALARSSSYYDGGVIGKGTQSGMSKTYTMRSCFAFSSIGVQLNQQSDRSRFTMLGLMNFEKYHTKGDFEKFEKKWNTKITDEFVQQLQARTISLLPVILKNSRTFADAVASVIGQRRVGDQVGSMLAGAYSIINSKEISYDDAVEWVKQRDWDEERGLEFTKDEIQLFSKLMGHPLKVESNHGTIERTIGELILVADHKIQETGLSAETAGSRLRRIGILVRSHMILVSNTAPGIKTILRDTSWANNHYKILERLPEAQRVDPRVYYPGCNSRGVSLPVGMISEGYHSEKTTDTTATGEKPEPELFNGPSNDDDLPF